ncbi:MAG: helicase, partial [Leptospiraceae bacterium]|nr:helicase [Leptospiraceae bacterium]
AELAQNLLFNLDDWTKNLPIVNITEDCVLVRTRDSQTMELLTGPIKGKKIIIEEISPNAILIDKNKVQEVIQIAEKLNIIVNLRQ